MRHGKAGHYDYGNAPGPVVAKVGRIESICEDFGIPLRAAALQFPLAHPAVVSVIPGMATIGHVTATRELLEVRIPDAFWRALRDEELVRADAPLPAAGEAA